MSYFRRGLFAVGLAAAVLAPASLARGANYAFLVAVKTYPARSGLASLSYTEEDVHDLAAALRQSGYAEENVVLLTQQAAADEPRYNPIADNIRRELDLLLASLREQDTVLVALTGHGVQYKEERSEGQRAPGAASATLSRSGAGLRPADRGFATEMERFV